MSKLNAGDVTVTLNGKDHVLRPTLRALDLVSGQFGGLQKAHELIVARNFSAMVFIINAGLNYSGRAAQAISQEVYDHGVNNDLVVPLVTFNAILGNGGQPLPDAPVDEPLDSSGGAEGNG